ncbi:MAG: acyl-CoA dehydrogenase family protein, partial [Lacisediminimonas sp.]|nr:acyl-CoA dehydrogenase family protein [Lacisediminimonas sp.]
QKADAYAHERRQMRAPGLRDASQADDPIIRHPAVQRLLDTQRAWVDAGRVLAYQTAIELDVAKHHPNPARRQQADKWCALVTPVLKASWTDQAFHGSSDCLQVFGGHGYVREWGVEQIVRDSRVAMIYEGTNEIQAQDLLFRKVLSDQGRGLDALLNGLQADLQGDNAASVQRTQEGFARLRDLLAAIESSGAAASEKLYPVAGDFLRVMTIALMAWAWSRLDAAGAPGNGGQAFVRWVWPELTMRRDMVLEALKA